MRAFRGIFAEPERPSDPAVGQHRRRAHHAFDDLEAGHGRVAIEIGDHTQTQALALRKERTEIGRKRGRQHRDRAVGQINRATALARFSVERATRLNVFADVGDRDPNPVAVLIALDPDRVVVIARVLRIDGWQGNFP